MISVGIVGGTGYTGVELLRLLVSHPNVDLKMVQNNIVMCDLDGLKVKAEFFLEKMEEHGVLALSLRYLVTHYDLEREDIEKELSIIEGIAKEQGEKR